MAAARRPVPATGAPPLGVVKAARPTSADSSLQARLTASTPAITTAVPPSTRTQSTRWRQAASTTATSVGGNIAYPVPFSSGASPSSSPSATTSGHEKPRRPIAQGAR